MPVEILAPGRTRVWCFGSSDVQKRTPFPNQPPGNHVKRGALAAGLVSLAYDTLPVFDRFHQDFCRQVTLSSTGDSCEETGDTGENGKNVCKESKKEEEEEETATTEQRDTLA